MKRKIILIFTIFVVLNLFLGCSNPSSLSTSSISKEKTYKVESGVITYSTYQTAWNRILNWTEPSYVKIESIRNYCMSNTISDHTIETDVTLNEIKEFMLSHGFSKRQTENEIKLIKEIGNDIGFFEYRYGKDKAVWMYVTE